MKTEKIVPAFFDNLWGGVKLREKYGKQTEKDPVAESWELSFHASGKSRLTDGRTIEEATKAEDLGVNTQGFPFFPTLIKFIDARENLSVQVHPSDQYALKHENSFGKTEMWYIVEADEGAGIYLGFKKDVTEEEFKTAIREKTLMELLNFYPVKAGDCYFIPSGTLHAIGAGCLICEIQQNSNLTYRVYDYGRKDKNGKERELHVEKALLVTDLHRFQPISLQAESENGSILGVSKYFTTTFVSVNGEKTLYLAGKSFVHITVVEGCGEIGGVACKTCESVFVPATETSIQCKGEMKLIMADVRKYYVGIDLGGTFIKGGIVDDQGNIIVSDKVPTQSEGGAEVVATNIAELCKTLLKKANLLESDVEGVGIGVPGMIDSKNGEVIYSNNLQWEHFEIGKIIEEKTGLPVKIANDANVAALGEVKFGGAKEYDNVIMLTLGTGVGGGIVVDGKLVEGNKGAGAELGHSVIVARGEQCTCGRKGCLEAYASATALIRDTKRAMEAHKDSKMWEIASLDQVTGETAFRYKDEDVYAKEVVENYIYMLGVGITNFANVFRPEAVLLGGGVCAQGDNLIDPLKKQLKRELFAGEKGPQVELVKATLENKAGIVGAAALLM